MDDNQRTTLRGIIEVTPMNSARRIPAQIVHEIQTRLYEYIVENLWVARKHACIEVIHPDYHNENCDEGMIFLVIYPNFSTTEDGGFYADSYTERLKKIKEIISGFMTERYPEVEHRLCVYIEVRKEV